MQIKTIRLTPPAALLTCAPAPDVPNLPSSSEAVGQKKTEQEEVASYVTDLWAAGDDCRTKLKAIRRWNSRLK